MTPDDVSIASKDNIFIAGKKYAIVSSNSFLYLDEPWSLTKFHHTE